MSKFEIVMPKMGESVEEATITKWFVKDNDTVEEDDVLLEIATDKVDSEIPSPVAGVITKILFKENDVVAVGEVIAIIDMEGTGSETGGSEPAQQEESKKSPEPARQTITTEEKTETGTGSADYSKSERFYSPLVKNIASKENISLQELDSIQGSGRDGRVSKDDVLNYLQQRTRQSQTAQNAPAAAATAEKPKQKVSVSVNAEDEIIEMDRMRKMIAEHMVHSVQTAPHVTNMIEADVTNIVLWRNKVKNQFQDREKEKLTFLPVFIEAAVKALKDFPRINASVDGDRIIIRKRINMGIAVALPDGNLIVPVIKDADQKNLLGITREINRLANQARSNKLSPDDIQGGTFSLTNFGTFKNVMGTPIINQPQVAILATGNIEKKPAVVETPTGDVIAIRHKMFLSLSYDHRVVDGALGGAYLKKLADYLEEFDMNRTI
ncbi:MAG TPA: dihydrolipoamide acetyltransferase family protein [Bacteroidales bacterium]|nr:dihydrolipoamide acetyltransferase family protein [Bacteroidales bacterium]